MVVLYIICLLTADVRIPLVVSNSCQEPCDPAGLWEVGGSTRGASPCLKYCMDGHQCLPPQILYDSLMVAIRHIATVYQKRSLFQFASTQIHYG